MYTSAWVALATKLLDTSQGRTGGRMDLRASAATRLAYSAPPHWPTPQRGRLPKKYIVPAVAPVYTPTRYGYAPLPQIMAPTTKPLRRVRTWPALVTLFLLAPMVAEMLTGSTPPLNFIAPQSLLLQTGLYGSGAILAREIARRRRLGWWSIALLGLAYGILEEGLTIGSWFNPYWPDVLSLGGYGRALDTNWVWALELTIFHAVFSILIPVVLVEALFPRLAARLWLGRKGYWLVVVWLTLISLATLGLLGMAAPAAVSQGAYWKPPVMWFGALALAIACVWLGTRVFHAPTAARSVARRAPRLTTLRFAGFFATVIFFALNWAGPKQIADPAILLVLVAGFAAFMAWRIHRWSRRRGWGARHRLALATGALLFFVALGPILEHTTQRADKNTAGMTVAAVGWLIFFIVLAWRARRTERHILPGYASA